MPRRAYDEEYVEEMADKVASQVSLEIAKLHAALKKTAGRLSSAETAQCSSAADVYRTLFERYGLDVDDLDDAGVVALGERFDPAQLASDSSPFHFKRIRSDGPSPFLTDLMKAREA